MMYSYSQERLWVLSPEGQRALSKVRDHVLRLLNEAGACQLGRVLGVIGDNWHSMACVDRMLELGELREISQGNVAGQYRIFVRAGQ